MLDLPRQASNPPMLDSLRGLLEQHGINTPPEIILDLLSRSMGVLDVVQPLVAVYNETHPITRGMSNSPNRYPLTYVRPVRPIHDPESGNRATELILSSEQSFSAGLDEVLSGRVAPPERFQLVSQPMGVASSPMNPMGGEAGGWRMVVYGTSELVRDQAMLTYHDARRLMLNTMSWLAEREEALDIPPHQIPGTPIVLDPGQLRVIFLLVVVLLPAGLFFGGVSYSMLRRRK
jgi:hypothetical protein